MREGAGVEVADGSKGGRVKFRSSLQPQHVDVRLIKLGSGEHNAGSTRRKSH